MYLFDRSGDNIEIYSLEPKRMDIKNYRQQEMEKIPFEQRILRIETNTKDLPFNEDFTNNPFSKPIDIDHQKLTYNNKKTIGTEYHKLGITRGTANSIDYVEEKMKGYYFGNYDSSQMVRVFRYDEHQQRLNFILYLLLNNYYHKERENSKIKYIENIINIPESLYLLELINRGQFSLLDNKDITEQLSLFKISNSPVKTYTLKELEEIGKYGFDPNAVNTALNNVEESKSIFERIRRK